MVQLSTSFTYPERHNAQRHRQTDRRQYDANSRSYRVTVRSAGRLTWEEKHDSRKDCNDGQSKAETIQYSDHDAPIAPVSQRFARCRVS